MLRHRERLRVLGKREDSRIIPIDGWRKVIPGVRKRSGEINMAAPEPSLMIAQLNQAQRLRVMHDDDVELIEPLLGGIGVRNVAVHGHGARRELHRVAMQAVVYILGEGKELRRSIDDQPLGLNAHVIHERGQAREDLGDPAALVGRIDMQNLDAAQPARLLEYAFDGGRSDERLIAIQQRLLGDARGRGRVHLLSTESGPATAINDRAGAASRRPKGHSCKNCCSCGCQ